jgi:hypothetical protein
MNDGIQAVNLSCRNSALGRVLPVGEKSSTTAISLFPSLPERRFRSETVAPQISHIHRPIALSKVY